MMCFPVKKSTKRFVKSQSLKNHQKVRTYIKNIFLLWKFIYLPCLISNFSTAVPNISVFLQTWAATSTKLGCTWSANILPAPKPNDDLLLLETSPKTTPKLEMGCFTAFCNSLKCPPAYWIPKFTVNNYQFLIKCDYFHKNVITCEGNKQTENIICAFKNSENP